MTPSTRQPAGLRRRLIARGLAEVSAIVLGVLLAAIALVATAARDGAPTGALGWISRGGWFLVALGWWGPLVVFVMFRLATLRRHPGLRTTARMLAEGAGLVAGWYLLIWLYARDLLANSGWLRAVALAGLVVLGSMVLMSGLRALLVRLALRWAGWGRLRTTPVRVAGWVIGGMGAAAATATVITALEARRPLPPEDLVVATAPVRRLVFWAIDGVDQNQLTYWTALRSEGNVSALALSGASTYLRWAPGSTSWTQALTGQDLRRTLDADPGPGPLPRVPIRLTDAVQAAYPGVVRPWLGKARTPGFWEVASWAGRDVDVIGWSWFVNSPRPGDQVIYPPAYRALRKVQEGDDREVISGMAGDPTLLMPLRDLARPPALDWRGGAMATEAEANAFERAAGLGVDPEGLWDDRFRLRVALTLLERERRRVQALYLDYPLRLAEGAASTAPDEAERLNRAVYAYLDVFDHFVGQLRSGLRPGDLLVLLFVPPPLITGAAAGQPGTATLILYGEKAALETSEPGALEVPDITPTLLYLQGLCLSDEMSGAVGWALLQPGLEGHLRLGTVPSYRRIRLDP